METNNTTTSNGVHTTHTKDNAAKIVFGDPVLCAQFLKGYTDIPLFKEIKPEDIENVSSHFLPLFQESRDSDTVNKIRIGDSEIYLIALIEHHLLTMFDPKDTGAHFPNRSHIMGNKQDRCSLFPQLFKFPKTLTLKEHISYGERLIYDQNLRLNADSHGKGKTGIHTTGVVFNRVIDVFSKF